MSYIHTEHILAMAKTVASQLSIYTVTVPRKRNLPLPLKNGLCSLLLSLMIHIDCIKFDFLCACIWVWDSKLEFVTSQLRWKLIMIQSEKLSLKYCNLHIIMAWSTSCGEQLHFWNEEYLHIHTDWIFYSVRRSINWLYNIFCRRKIYQTQAISVSSVF